MVGFSDGYLTEKEEDLFRNRIKTDYPATEWAYIWRILKGEEDLKPLVSEKNLKLIENKIKENICFKIAMETPHGEKRTPKEVLNAINDETNDEHDYFKDLYEDLKGGLK